MKREVKLAVYVIMLISLVTCGIIGVRRIQAETKYKDVEIAVKYADLIRIAIEEEKPLTEVLEYYKSLGVTTILAKEMVVATASEHDYTTLKGFGEITLVEGYILRFYYPEATELKPDTRYIVCANRAVAERILEYYLIKGIDLDMYESDGTYFIDLNEHSPSLTTVGIGFDVAGLNKAADLGYNIAIHLKWWRDPTEESIRFVLNELEQINNVETIYFSDSKVPAYDTETFQEYLQDKQIGFVEFTSNKQQGFKWLAQAISENDTNYKMVRMHTIEDGKLKTTPVSDLMDRYELALSERNNRVFLFKLPNTEEITEDIAYFDESITAFEQVIEKEDYHLVNHVGNFNLPVVSKIVTIIAGLASIMIFMLFVAEAGFVKTSYVLGVLGTIGYIGLVFLKVNVAARLMALFGSIMFPTYAVATAMKEERKTISETLVEFLKVMLYSFGGVLTIIGCLSRTSFALGLDLFLGVKVATVAPIALVLAYLLFKEHQYDFKYYTGWMGKTITYRDIIIIGAVLLILKTYITRSGNSGTISDFERSFRQILNNVLGVRPRTKEFLISYPVLLALLYYGYRERYILLVILAVIGPASFVNTYAHIHTPILISLVRSAYGIVFGIILGLILIKLLDMIGKVIKKWQHKTQIHRQVQRQVKQG